MAKINPNEGISFNLWSVVQVVIVLSLFALGIYILYQVRLLFVMLFLAFIFSSSLRPVVNRMEQRKVPRSLATFIALFSVVVIFVLIISFILIPLSGQVDQLIKYLNSSEFAQAAETFFSPKGNTPFLNAAREFLQNNLNEILGSFSSSLGQINTGVQGIVDNAKKVFNLVIYTFGVFVFAWYMLEQDQQRNYLLTLLIKDEKRRNRIKRLIEQLESSMGRWLRGQLTLMLIIGVLTYIVLVLLGVPFALPLAILAGLLEMIPNVGPFSAAVITAPIVLLTNGWIPMVILLVSYLIIQQLENYYLVPRVMQAAVGINAFVILIGVFASGLIFNSILGSLLAVPLMVVAQLSLRFLRDPRNRFW